MKISRAKYPLGNFHVKRIFYGNLLEEYNCDLSVRYQRFLIFYNLRDTLRA